MKVYKGTSILMLSLVATTVLLMLFPDRTLASRHHALRLQLMIDETHSPQRRSWVASANQHADFPIQNLPLGIFTPPQGGARRGGVAIGDEIFDLAAALDLGLFAGPAEQAAQAACGSALNPLFALGSAARLTLRQRVSDLLAVDGKDAARAEGMRGRLLHRAAECQLHVPAEIGDYTDFFAGIHHATNAGKLFRPDNPLMPNYKYVPIGYHGRASSISASGTPVRRPNGQRKPANETVPTYGASRNLDFELELGVWVGPGNALGEPVPIAQAAQHVAGFCLLNDWSARDIQGWEYQPLGPFLSKSFATTVSPWVVTLEALAPYRVALARPADDPPPLAYLDSAETRERGAFDIRLEVLITTPRMEERGAPPHRLGLTSYRHAYWTIAQMVAHHTVNGCALVPGDLLGTGTLSGPTLEEAGALAELTQGGKNPVKLPDGETRTFLEDGDVVTFRGWCEAPGAARIGLGEVSARILAALPG